MAIVTIQKAREEIRTHLKNNGGLSKEGGRYLEAADVLRRAGLLDLVLALDSSGMVGDPLDVIDHAVEAAKRIKGRTVPEALPTAVEDKPAPEGFSIMSVGG